MEPSKYIFHVWVISMDTISERECPTMEKNVSNTKDLISEGFENQGVQKFRLCTTQRHGYPQQTSSWVLIPTLLSKCYSNLFREEAKHLHAVELEKRHCLSLNNSAKQKPWRTKPTSIKCHCHWRVCQGQFHSDSGSLINNVPRRGLGNSFFFSSHIQ